MELSEVVQAVRKRWLVVAVITVVFAAATGAVPLGDTVVDLARLGDAAARVLARAVARGVFSATSLPGHAPSSPLAGTGLPPAWRDVFGA